jgi:hypothetical protein
MFTLEPTNLGQPSQADRAAMPVLRSFIPIPTPTLALTNNNQFRFITQAGFTYQPESSTNITSGWGNFGSAINGSGLTTNVNFATTGSRSFYRVKVSRNP